MKMESHSTFDSLTELGMAHEQLNAAIPLALNLAQQGNAHAQQNVGRLYELGLRVQQDLAQAIYWYRKAADHGRHHANITCK